MNDTPLEDRVHDALHRRVDPLQHAPLTVGDVRQRARRIQRRRAAATGAAVAAALAVAVPFGPWMTGPTQRTDVPPATRTPEVVTGPVLVDVRSADPGAPPTVPLLDTTGPRLTLGETSFDVPAAYRQVTPYRDGWIAVVSDEGVLSVQILDSDFAVEDEVSPASPLTVAPDGSRVAYAFHDGNRWIVVSLDTSGDEPERTTPLPDGPQEAHVRTVGFLPDGGLVATRTDPDDGSQTTFVVTADGTTEPVPGFTSPVSTSQAGGLLAGQTRFSGDGSCSQVVDGRAGGGVELWETCEHSFGSFSPDGRHLVGLAAYFDNVSPVLTILDAVSGEPVLDFELAGARDRLVGIASEVVWEDDDTFLATLVDRNQQYVVRLGLDGTVERVAGPVPNDDATVSLRLTPGRAG